MLSFSGEQQLQIAKKFALQSKNECGFIGDATFFAFEPRSQINDCTLVLYQQILEIILQAILIAGALTMFDSARFQVSCYSLVADDESMWRRTIETSCGKL